MPSRYKHLLLVIFCAVFLWGCAAATPAATEIPTVPPTQTPLPPTETYTPLPPSATPTFTPTYTATAIPPTATDTPTPLPTDTPTATPTKTPNPVKTVDPNLKGWAITGDDIMMYFINLNTGGPVSCGDSLVAIRTGKKKSGDVADDVAAAVSSLLSYHSSTVLGFYNPLSVSTITLDSVEYSNDGLVTVNLSGTYVRTKDDCDNTRVKAQLWQTIRQFRDVKKTNIYLNGGPFGDKVSNDK